MKITTSKIRGDEGNFLAIALIFTGLAGLVLYYCLNLFASQSYSIQRSQNWNASIPVTEAGVEEALTHLNDNCLINDLNLSAPVNPTADSWQRIDKGYSKTTHLPGDLGYYEVSVLTDAPYTWDKPAILSTGYVPSGNSSSGQAFFAVIGDTPTDTTLETVLTTNLARKVKVMAGTDGVFAKGMVAKKTIDLNGNNVASDSFNSSDPAFSNNGQYPLGDSSRTKANGDMATISGLTNSIAGGNANISGHLSTGHGGSASIGPNGKVGDKDWMADPSKTGIQPGHFADDMNVSFPDVKIPFTSGEQPVSGPLTLTNGEVSIISIPHTDTVYPANPQGPVTTNTETRTETSYPSAGTYLGTPSTNTQEATTAEYPASGTYLGVVQTNTATTTTASYPNGGYLGSVRTNTTSTITTTYPSAGTYLGTVRTNITATNTTTLPSTGTYTGSITTNTTLVTVSCDQYPASGTYLGSVTTNMGTTYTDKHTGGGNPPPNTSCFVYNPVYGTGNNSDKIVGYDYTAIASYTYKKITSYSYNKLDGFVYDKITSYTYESISTYTYTKIVSYTFAKIVSYTWYETQLTTNEVRITYDVVLDTGKYKVSDLSGNVLVRGDAVLYVTDDINFSGGSVNGDGITIQKGASLRLYMGGEKAKIAGGGILNNGGYATNFFYYGLPSNKELQLSGNGKVIGVIYAPQAAYTLNGGGNDTVDFIGASVTDTAKLNGHFNFHYDEALLKYGPKRGYIITSWEEIPLTQTQ